MEVPFLLRPTFESEPTLSAAYTFFMIGWGIVLETLITLNAEI